MGSAGSEWSEGSTWSADSSTSFGSWSEGYIGSSFSDGRGYAPRIEIRFCGDGIVNPPEACDQGEGNVDRLPGACSTQCLWNPGSSCQNDLGCSTNLCRGRVCTSCTQDVQCGNQRLCLFGTCAKCGDGIVTPPEICDDANESNADTCNNRCRLTLGQPCGQNGECGSDLCLARACTGCSHDAQCGPGRLCLSGSCTTCGNGIVQEPEACDDGNLINTDGCSNRCHKTVGQRCTGAAECGTSLCSSGVCKTCTADAACGQEGRCSSGSCVLSQRCRTDGECGATDLCVQQLCSSCGDGIVLLPETCDDGNRSNGDGCSDHCLFERGAAGAPLTANVFEMPFLPGPAGGTNAGGGALNTSLTDTPHGASGMASHAPVGDTGPATLAVMAAGAAVGGAWTRRRKRARG